MRRQMACLSALAFLLVVMLGLAGGLWAQEGKQLMLAITSNTEGEINPCG